MFFGFPLSLGGGETHDPVLVEIHGHRMERGHHDIPLTIEHAGEGEGSRFVESLNR